MERDELISYIKPVCGLTENIIGSLVDDLSSYIPETNTYPYDNLLWQMVDGVLFHDLKSIAIEKIDLIIGGESVPEDEI